MQFALWLYQLNGEVIHNPHAGLTIRIEVPITATFRNQVADLVVHDLHGGTVIERAKAAAAAVDSKCSGTGCEEKHGELHLDYVCIDTRNCTGALSLARAKAYI